MKLAIALLLVFLVSGCVVEPYDYRGHDHHEGYR